MGLSPLCFYFNRTLLRLDNRYIDIIKELKKQINKKLAQRVEKHIASRGIYSLSETSLSTLMWSHYADNHRGVCLGFQFSEEYVSKMKKDFGMGIFQCLYDAENPVVNYLVTYMPYLRYAKEIFCGWLMISAIVFASKNKDWSYEQEVRLIKEQKGLSSFDRKNLSEVILGLRIDKKSENTIRTLLSGKEWKHVKYRRIVKAETDYNLRLEDA